jgi:FKBP-type peptidyl-prolyl cis-trans isomerase FklB
MSVKKIREKKGNAMKFRLLTLFSILLLASQVNADENLVLKNQKDKVSYIIGMDIGGNLKKQSIDVDPDVLARGIKDALSGRKSLMTEQEIQETTAAFEKEMMAKQAELAKRLGEMNQKEGQAFLVLNKQKEGVKTLPSGLQYKVIKAGTGKKPKLTDTVTTQYRGTLINGTEFDSSYRHKRPATFQVNRVIPGWSEALQLMGVGSKWQLFIPPNLAYGEQGRGREIGPNATLIFEVELLAIEANK